MIFRHFVYFALFASTIAYADLSYTPTLCGHPTQLILDTPSLKVARATSLPEHFRSTDDLKNAHITNTTGFADLHLSGGAQFSQQTLQAIQKKIPNLKYDIDLRREPHAFINDGIPISVFGMPHDWSNTCQKQIPLAQSNFMDFLNSHKNQMINAIKHADDSSAGLHGTPFSMEIKQVQSEAELTKALGIRYGHVGVVDHYAPTKQEAIDFVEFIKQIPAGTPIYMHCHAGQGRTSTFMMMYDMMRNAKRVSFEDIAQRQIALGSVDLLDHSHIDAYKQGPAAKRAQFLRGFYDYCKNNSDNFKTSWAEYRKNNLADKRD